jgi:hypothetical protein
VGAEPIGPVLPDGVVVIVKRDCPTCRIVEPVLAQLDAAPGVTLTVFTQDDPSFPAGVGKVVHDDDLDVSYHHHIETVPSVLRVVDGVERDRTVGWSRDHWETLTGVGGLGIDLPEMRPGCGSLSVDPAIVDQLRARFEGGRLRARRVQVADLEDEVEAMFDRGWSDGLPVVPPTEVRVLKMLDGTDRSPDDVIAAVPPDLVECTVEKVAINAVLAGCKPEYLPVVLTAVEAACTDTFNMHGLLATTMPVGPVVIVNGPIRHRIGMNDGVNVLGQGNRANSTIGRALQLVIRNVGGGKPGGVDRATQGNPGKLSFCFPENEERSPWEPLHVERGFDPDASTVTLFPGEGPRGVVDQLSRDPDSLARSLAACLRSVQHPKLAMAFDAILIVSPEHARVFAEGGWTKAQLREGLQELTLLDGRDIVRGADGIAEGLPEWARDAQLPKFRPDGLLIVHAGGGAGLFSTIIGGWVNGETGSQPVTKEIAT